MNDPVNDWTKTLRIEFDQAVADAHLDFLQHSGQVRLYFNVDTTTVQAATAFTDSVNQLLGRLPSLQNAVADAAFDGYSLLVEQLGKEESLPEANDAKALLPFYKLTAIYLPNEPQEGHFGLGFECEFEEEHGMGIRFHNWQIEESGDESVAFSLD